MTYGNSGCGFETHKSHIELQMYIIYYVFEGTTCIHVHPGWLPIFHGSLEIFPSLSSCIYFPQFWGCCKYDCSMCSVLDNVIVHAHVPTCTCTLPPVHFLSCVY